MSEELFAQTVAAVIRAARLRTSNEAALQASIEEVLKTAAIEYEREKAISKRDRPDFLLAGGAVPIEAKARYPKKKIYRQLQRYAEHDSVKAIILVTGTAMGMPAQINGKPIHVVSIGMGALGC